MGCRLIPLLVRSLRIIRTRFPTTTQGVCTVIRNMLPKQVLSVFSFSHEFLSPTLLVIKMFNWIKDLIGKSVPLNLRKTVRCQVCFLKAYHIIELSIKPFYNEWEERPDVVEEEIIDRIICTDCLNRMKIWNTEE